MGDRSGIEWTDATWNPVTGCTKVSAGCDHCYAERITGRFRGKGAFEAVAVHPGRLGLPLRWRAPRRVFVNSMSDLWHPAVQARWIAAVFAVMALAPRHTFQVLTKRPARMRSLLSAPLFPASVAAAADVHGLGDLTEAWVKAHWPLRNVWLGVSAETQPWADTRIPVLLAAPAAVRFVSAEPLLGPEDLRVLRTRGRLLDALTGVSGRGETPPVPALDWVITGGESGPSARPMHPSWARGLRDQCTAAGVPFFFRQWGTWVHCPWAEEMDPRSAAERGLRLVDSRGALGPPPFRGWREDHGTAGFPCWAPAVRRRRAFPDHKTLDGETWRQFPAAGGGAG